MALNIERVKEQVRKAIKVAPFSLQLKREVVKPDGRGGFIKTGEVKTVFNGECLFDNSGDSPFGLIRTEAGRAEKQDGPYMIIVCDDSTSIEIGDFFEFESSRFEVTKVTNVLAMNIYWQVKLKEVKS